MIDDSPLQLAVRQATLLRAGFSVVAEASATQALERIRVGGEKTDAVITDHLMPDMGGVEFVRKLREIDQDVPVIVLSGLPDAGTEYAGLNVHFEMKPCPSQELIALVRSLTSNANEKAS